MAGCRLFLGLVLAVRGLMTLPALLVSVERVL